MQTPAWAALLSIAAASVALAAGTRSAPSQPSTSTFVGVLDEHPTIQYANRPTRDRVSALNHAIVQGTRSLEFQERDGYLRPLLEALGIQVESQLLVFSKTGIQRGVTGPRSPRALFFDDSLVVGYIPGARWIELAAHDPEQGVVFYTLEQTAATSPKLTRRTDCLSCHVSASTLEVPGMIHRSNVVGTEGELMPMFGSHTVDHRTPLTERWGGWFVTGNYTKPPYDGTAHRGNVTVAVHPQSGPATTSNEVFIQWLNSAPETRGYPSTDSDIAALMLFDHQMHAINLLTRLNWESRVAEGNVASGPSREMVAELTDYLLFVGEVAPPGRVVPRVGFAERFTAPGPRDRLGRSLRQLDLDARLLRYPCSYMVYTTAFENLPLPARTAVYKRMWAVLIGQDRRPKYSHLSESDRRAIIEIIGDTKQDLPDVWRR